MPARHQIATLSTHVHAASGAQGYLLDGVPYGVMEMGGILGVQDIARAHALALGITQLVPVKAGPETRQAAALAFALHHLAAGRELGRAERATLRAAQPVGGGPVHIRTDGSADKGQDGKNALSIGYLLNAQPYATPLPAGNNAGHEGIAERTAIYAALRHAKLLGFSEFFVQSDHKFHTRRYAEDLVNRTRRKSDSLERLDALVDGLQPHVHFEYTPTLDTDAPHRLAMHAHALSRLSQGMALTRAQQVALRRVHFALKHRLEGKVGEVLF